MKLSEFAFELPEELIAKYPAEDREESRLMVVHKGTGKVEHKTFKDVIDYFDEGDVMIHNNTKVFPARLYGWKEKTGAQIQVFLLRELDPETLLWDVLVDPARKIRIGNKLFFGEDEELVAEVIDNTTSRGRTIRFLMDGGYEEFKEKIYKLGVTPLPDEIKRKVEPEDEERYQTIYAKNEGAVAAPFAGLHFSKLLMKRLELKGIEFADVTLHIGWGTFREVEVEDLTKHRMDSEEAFVSQATADMVNKAKQEKRRICAVSNSTMRAIESSVSTDGLLKPYAGWTNRFIFPPYDFSIADSMITNFHLPSSTLMMMVSAFLGHELTMDVYQQAIKEKYKFHAYGDAMLII